MARIAEPSLRYSPDEFVHWIGKLSNKGHRDIFG